MKLHNEFVIVRDGKEITSYSLVATAYMDEYLCFDPKEINELINKAFDAGVSHNNEQYRQSVIDALSAMPLSLKRGD